MRNKEISKLPNSKENSARSKNTISRWRHITSMKKVIGGSIAFALIVVAGLAKFEDYLESGRNIFTMYTEYTEEYDQPILINFQVKHTENTFIKLLPWEKRLSRKILSLWNKLESRQEISDWYSSNLLDITVSYEGDETLLFHTLYVRHFAGKCISGSTGQLVSSGKYRFEYSYDENHAFKLSPPLVLNPKDASLLNFEIELAQHGEFLHVCGTAVAKLGYQTGKGEQGILPLVAKELIQGEVLEFPVFTSKVGGFGEYGIFKLLNAADPNRYVNSETYKINRHGAIKGKVIKKVDS